MRVTADTNVLVSAVIADGKLRQFLRGCVERKWTLLSSPVLLSEFLEVLRRPKLGLAEDEARRALVAVVEVAEIVEPRTPIHAISQDPDDDRVLEAAVEGRADCIVSGDRHLLRLRSFEEIPILRVADSLAQRAR